MTNDPATALIAELEADNRRLRGLLDQKGAVGELRHRLRSTLAVLRIIIHQSAATPRRLEDYVAQLDDRVEALVRAQTVADHTGGIDLHALLAEELVFYGAREDERVELTGPRICLQHRAGQMLAMALHELAVNSITHGSLGALHGRLDVSWHIVDADIAPALVFTWKEAGMSDLPKPSSPGFGTEVLTRTLANELKAETMLCFEPDGLRCTIRFPLFERIGHVVPD